MRFLIFVLLLVAIFFSACNSRYLIPPEISSLREKKRKEIIIVDAGHGGKDAGAISKRDGYEEKELTLKTALLVQDCLHQLGYKTVMTRDQDIFLPLTKRSEIANSLNADFFVSIHYNFSSNREARGVEVYYYKEKKTPPSDRIVKSRSAGNSVLKKIIASTGAESRGVKEENFAVIRETTMPAILVEAGFLSNQKEREKVCDPQYQRFIAWGIAKGIDQYFENSR